MIDREIEEAMDEHEKKQHGRREKLTPTEEASRAGFYALWLRNQCLAPDEAAELVRARYPRVKHLLSSRGKQGGE